MTEKYSYGIELCYPDASYSQLAKYAIKISLVAAGTHFASLVGEGITKIIKPLFGGLPVSCDLIITDTNIEFRPKYLSSLFFENIEALSFPKIDIISVEKSFNFLILHNVVDVKLKDFSIKFYIVLTQLNTNEILERLRK